MTYPYRVFDSVVRFALIRISQSIMLGELNVPFKGVSILPSSYNNCKLENWHSQRVPRWGGGCHYDICCQKLTFDLLTPKSIGAFLSISSICVWSMKSVGLTLFELSRYNEVWTDGRTDRQTDGRTDNVITIGLPHLRWRGPNYLTDGRTDRQTDGQTTWLL